MALFASQLIFARNVGLGANDKELGRDGVALAAKTKQLEARGQRVEPVTGLLKPAIAGRAPTAGSKSRTSDFPISFYSMKTCRFLLCSFIAAFASFAHAQEKRAALSAEQKAFLAQYEAVRTGLAADDLAAAKKAATAIAAGPAADNAKKIAAADSIAAAREAFKALSKQAVTTAAGQSGYYHAHCPMVPNDEGNWVQTSKKISNPYFGKSMATCGSIEN